MCSRWASSLMHAWIRHTHELNMLEVGLPLVTGRLSLGPRNTSSERASGGSGGIARCLSTGLGGSTRIPARLPATPGRSNGIAGHLSATVSRVPSASGGHESAPQTLGPMSAGPGEPADVSGKQGVRVPEVDLDRPETPFRPPAVPPRQSRARTGRPQPGAGSGLLQVRRPEPGMDRGGVGFTRPKVDVGLRRHELGTPTIAVAPPDIAANEP